MVIVLKRKWSNAHEGDAFKIMFEIEGEPIALVQYLGLTNQPTLKLGNRHTRKKINKLITKELKSTPSLKRTLYNVEEQLAETEEVKGPSSLPTMRTVNHLKQK